MKVDEDDVKLRDFKWKNNKKTIFATMKMR